MNRKLLATRIKDKDTVVVLYELLDDVYTPYVTWLSRVELPNETLWGHYSTNVVDAVHDFENR